MTLSGTSMVNAGGSATFDLDDATPSQTWYLIYSFSNAGSTIFGTPFEVGLPWALLYTGTTDTQGEASHTLTVPANGSGLTVYFEAATNAGSIENSNLHTLVVN